MLLLDHSSSSALVVDTAVPPSAHLVHEAVIQAWPRLAGRVTFIVAPMDSVALGADDVVVSCHACGALTDQVLSLATAARARVAVLPCCHDADTCDTGSLTGWVEPALAIDTMRALRLDQQGYLVWTQVIPAEITQKNRLLIGAPRP